MAFFTRLNSSVSLLTPSSYDDEDDTIALADKLNELDAKIGDTHSGAESSTDSTDKQQQQQQQQQQHSMNRLTSAQFAELRLSQLKSHSVVHAGAGSNNNLTLAELQRLQHLTGGDSHSRRLTLAELQKLQQQAPIVDSRHAAELLFARSRAITPAVAAAAAAVVDEQSLGVHGSQKLPAEEREVLLGAEERQQANNMANKLNFEEFDLELGVQV